LLQEQELQSAAMEALVDLVEKVTAVAAAEELEIMALEEMVPQVWSILSGKPLGLFLK
jgi:hypothetical protein